MAEVNINPMIDAFAELLSVIFRSVFLVIIDKVSWAIWNTIVQMLSMEHLGQSAAIVVLTLGILFCLYFYVMKFLAD